jgi:hypothetical protein
LQVAKPLSDGMQDIGLGPRPASMGMSLLHSRNSDVDPSNIDNRETDDPLQVAKPLSDGMQDIGSGPRPASMGMHLHSGSSYVHPSSIHNGKTDDPLQVAKPWILIRVQDPHRCA